MGTSPQRLPSITRVREQPDTSEVKKTKKPSRFDIASIVIPEKEAVVDYDNGEQLNNERLKQIKLAVKK